jgi:hypothetical protein
MNTANILERNRVILCHFDSYSAALNFARYGDSVLAPTPLPQTASDLPAPDEAGEQYTPAAVLDALVAKHGLNPAELKIDDDFEAWLADDIGPIRVHLVRFTTFEAPHEAIEPLGGVFKPISQMRGMPPLELNLMRQVFNLIIG